MAEIQRLNHRHEAIVNWLVANPHRSLTECAECLGYTLPWLSQVVHSDMFQAKYQERCREVGEIAVHTVKNRLTAVALLALQKTQERLESGASSERFILDATKNSLASLGYTQETITPQQIHQHLHVDASVLEAARSRAAARFSSFPIQLLEAGPSESSSSPCEEVSVNQG